MERILRDLRIVISAGEAAGLRSFVGKAGAAQSDIDRLLTE
jgi:hypothetical protein